MLWTIILILLILWALGFGGVFGASIGGLIHILLLIALIVLILDIVQRRRAV